ncbi:hypothetical protein KL86DPRO_10676 [uncultured delta proteobacterium]|uniref:Uncharacterized protein n=1 Tax=uncultured delta proteobacterium TaxID=34034 RepID=A0A212J4G9_9DELT|nr:hypothetical protein KL86DPRO_10676 [uncultured delta proteobacterium]
MPTPVSTLPPVFTWQPAPVKDRTQMQKNKTDTGRILMGSLGRMWLHKQDHTCFFAL